MRKQIKDVCFVMIIITMFVSMFFTIPLVGDLLKPKLIEQYGDKKEEVCHREGGYGGTFFTYGGEKKCEMKLVVDRKITFYSWGVFISYVLVGSIIGFIIYHNEKSLLA